MPRSSVKPHLWMLLAIVLAASSFPVGGAITDALPPAVMMFLRFTIAAGLFAPLVFYRHGLHLPTAVQLLRYVVLSVPLAVFFWCMFESLRYTTVLNTGALYTLVPVITAVYAVLINRESVSARRSIGLSMGTVGALWIVFKGDYRALIALDINHGDVVFLVGCLFMGMYNPLVKKLHRGEPLEVMTFWVLASAAVWLLLVSMGSLTAIDWSAVKAEVYGGIVYLSIFSTLITFFLLQLSVLRIGATKAAAYSFLTPLFVIFFSVLFVDAHAFPPVLLPGVLLVVLAMYVIQKEPAVLP